MTFFYYLHSEDGALHISCKFSSYDDAFGGYVARMSKLSEGTLFNCKSRGVVDAAALLDVVASTLK